MLPMGTFRDPHPLHTGTGMAISPVFSDPVERPCGAYPIYTPTNKPVFHIHAVNHKAQETGARELI